MRNEDEGLKELFQFVWMRSITEFCGRLKVLRGTKTKSRSTCVREVEKGPWVLWNILYVLTARMMILFGLFQGQRVED